MTQYTSSDLAQLGERLFADGLEAHLADLRRVTAAADALGLAPHARVVLLDPEAPRVARQRAYGVVARQLARARDVAVTQPVPAVVAPCRPTHVANHRATPRPRAEPELEHVPVSP